MVGDMAQGMGDLDVIFRVILVGMNKSYITTPDRAVCRLRT